MKPRDPQKIERIYQATLILVSEIGLASLTMSKIGKKAKLGMGTIYTYFESKEEIINSLYQALKRKHAIELYADIKPSQSFLEQFRTLFNAFFKYRYFSQDENFFIDQCKGSPALTAKSKELEENTYAPVNTLLEEGKALGLVKDIDNKLLIGYLIGGVTGYIAYMQNNQQPLTQTAIDTAFELCLGTIKV